MKHLAHCLSQTILISDPELHAFIPSCCCETTINTETFSFATASTSYQVISKREMLNFKDMNSYAISTYNEKLFSFIHQDLHLHFRIY